MGRVAQKNKCRGRTKSCHLKGIGYLLLKACTKMFIVAPLDPTRPNRATMFRNVVNRPMASYKQKRSFQHAARAAELRSAFKSTASVANARRGPLGTQIFSRKRFSPRCKGACSRRRVELVSCASLYHTCTCPDCENLHNPAPEAKDLSSNLLKL